MRNKFPAFAVGSSLVLAVAAFMFQATPTFAATKMMTTARKNWNQATVKWNWVSGASSYNIYFKESKAKMWTHSVVNLSSSTTWETIKYLVPGVGYKYVVSAVGPNGSEFWWSPEKSMVTSMMK
jgi:hypothetical protein